MAVEQLAAPVPDSRFKRKIRFRESLVEVFKRRELVRTLAERELRARYKQAFLGFAWAVVTPVTFMIVFTVTINRFADIGTKGAPYALFSFIGLMPWTFFSSSISHAGQSLLSNTSLLNKIYCPREVFPIASVCVATVDMLIIIALLPILFIATGYAPRITTFWVPLLFVVQAAFTIGLAMIISVFVVYLRDVRHALPLALQLGLFVTPIAFGVDDVVGVVPVSMRWLWGFINPLAPVVDSYRRTVLWGQAPDWGFLVPGAITAFAVLAFGYVIFKRLETGLADVA